MCFVERGVWTGGVWGRGSTRGICQRPFLLRQMPNEDLAGLAFKDLLVLLSLFYWGEQTNRLWCSQLLCMRVWKQNRLVGTRWKWRSKRNRLHRKQNCSWIFMFGHFCLLILGFISRGRSWCYSDRFWLDRFWIRPSRKLEFRFYIKPSLGKLEFRFWIRPLWKIRSSDKAGF